MNPDHDTTKISHRGIGEILLPTRREAPRRAAALSGATAGDGDPETTVTSIILTC